MLNTDTSKTNTDADTSASSTKPEPMPKPSPNIIGYVTGGGLPDGAGQAEPAGGRGRDGGLAAGLPGGPYMRM